MTDAAATERPGKRERTRALLLGTARELLHDRDWAQLSVEQIAEEADLVKATVFNHFGTKAALLQAVGVQWADEVRAKVDAVAPGGRPDRASEALTIIVSALGEEDQLRQMLRSVAIEEAVDDSLWAVLIRFYDLVHVAVGYNYQPRRTKRNERRHAGTAQLAQLIGFHLLLGQPDMYETTRRLVWSYAINS